MSQAQPDQLTLDPPLPWPEFSRASRATKARILIGLGHVAWIAIELIYLPELSALQAVYGGVGVVLLLLPMHPAVRRYLAPNATRRSRR